MTRKISIIIIVLIVSLLSACTPAEFDLTDFNRGEELLNELDYSQALVSFKNSINKNPNHTESYLKASDILILKKQFNEAISLLEAGRDFVDKKDALFSKLGEVYYLQFNFEEAKKNFKLAIENNSGNSQAALGYINSMSLTGDNELSSFILSRLDFQDDEITEVAKILHLMSSDIDKAVQTLEIKKDKLSEERATLLLQTINNFRDKPLIDKNMEFSRIMINQGLAGLAINLVEQVIAENEFYEGGYLFKSIIQYVTGKNNEALELINKAIQINSKSSLAFRYKGLILSSLNNIEDASNSFDTAVSLAKPEDKQQILTETLEFQKKNLLFEKASLTTTELLSLSGNQNYNYQLGIIYCVGEFEPQILQEFIAEFDSEEDFEKDLLNACLFIKQQNLNEANKIIVEVRITKPRDLFGIYLDLRTKLESNDVEAFNITKNELINYDTDGFFTNVIEAESK